MALSIHSGEDCGGYSAYIEIILNGTVTCKTKISDVFSAGSTLEWHGSELGSCKENEFDQNSEKIKFMAKTSHSDIFQNDDFCPKKLTIKMSSDRKFESETMTEWVDKFKNSDIVRTAKLVPQSFWSILLQELCCYFLSQMGSLKMSV